MEIKLKMKVTSKEVTIGDVAKGYKDNNEEGVVGYNGLLNIRPAYQREFVYKDKQRNEVIDSILNGYPLNGMFWVLNNDGTYEVLDGQQRTISFCQFINGDFSVQDDNGNPIYFHNMSEREQAQFKSYKLMVYVCEGDEKARLDYFKKINIQGEKLTEQELLNANYVGQWLSSAKQRFSKNNCVAYNIGKNYVKGSPIRQDFLETALDWISDGNIAEYMAQHQFDENSDELYNHYRKVIEWVERTFTNYRKEMQSVNWGKLYKTYGENIYNPIELEEIVKSLMENEEVTDKKGIYEYVLSGQDEYIARRLSKRSFSINDKRTAYEKQNGICPKCGKWHPFEEMEGDHKIAWWGGGKTIPENCQMLCKKCNGVKSGKSD